MVEFALIVSFAKYGFVLTLEWYLAACSLSAAAVTIYMPKTTEYQQSTGFQNSQVELIDFRLLTPLASMNALILAIQNDEIRCFRFQLVNRVLLESRAEQTAPT